MATATVLQLLSAIGGVGGLLGVGAVLVRSGQLVERVAALERGVTEVRADLAGLRADVTGLRVDVGRYSQRVDDHIGDSRAHVS